MSKDERSGPERPQDVSGEEAARRRLKVFDKRRTASPTSRGDNPADAEVEGGEHEEASQDPTAYLADLKRLQAEFENYRKRMMREQTEVARHSTAGLIKKLLPVLDNFERAATHDSDSKSLELLHKDLLAALRAEGLEEIPAEGEPFDPHVHEAVESREQEEVEVPTCISVYRTGYRLGDKVLRPAMVGVARPAERAEDSSEDAASG
jgi:molecular chaperone GrpE (heat shock protein)